MTFTKHRNLIAVAIPVFLLFVLIAVMRFVSAGIRPSQAVLATRNQQRGIATADPETRKAITARITGQIDAFRGNDYRRALSFSAQRFRESTTPERFQELMQQRYATLTNAKEIKFGRMLVQGEAAQAEVYVTGSKGDRRAFGYTLQKEGSDWNVVTVAPLLPPSAEIPTSPRRFDSGDN